jgi:ABC-type glycerol-3-phosphate transport system substrate-binding protein
MRQLRRGRDGGRSNKEAAARFVKFITGKSAAAVWRATSVETV